MIKCSCFHNEALQLMETGGNCVTRSLDLDILPASCGKAGYEVELRIRRFIAALLALALGLTACKKDDLDDTQKKFFKYANY